MKKIISKNNRGAALVSILIAVTFISIIATSLLYISASNYRMKVANNESKKNFYNVEGNVMKMTQKLRSNFTTTDDPLTIIKTYQDGADTKHYNCKALATILTTEGASTIGTVGGSSNAKNADISFTKGSDDFYKYDINVSSSNNAIEYYKLNAENKWEAFTGSEMSDGLYQIVFKNVEVTETSKNDDYNGYDHFENSIKTDIVINISRTSGGKKAVGGVGDFSILMDDRLIVDGSNFSTINIYGNTMTAQFAYNKTLKITTPVDSGGTGASAALSLAHDNRCNVMGDYFVVVGDIVIDGNSSLYLNGCNLTVYGNIYIKDRGALIMTDDSCISMVRDEKLPGYSAVSGIIISDGNAKKHIYPSSYYNNAFTDTNKYFKSLKKKDSYDVYAKYMRFNDTDASNDGILNNILNDVTNQSKNLIDVRIMTTGEKCLLSTDKFYGETIKVYQNGDTSTNGGLQNSLIFFTNQTGPIDIKEANINSTMISFAPLQTKEVHSITYSKLGPEEFNWLTIPSSSTSTYGYDKDVHKKHYDFNTTKGDYKVDMSIGDFFKVATYTNDEGAEEKLDANSLVQKLLNCSIESSDSSKPATSQTAIYMQNWFKDV